MRFQDKESHQIFLEPEGRNVPELYVQVRCNFPFPSYSFDKQQASKNALKYDFLKI